MCCSQFARLLVPTLLPHIVHVCRAPRSPTPRSIRHTRACCSPVQGGNAGTCLVLVQGTLNKKVRYCDRCHPVGIPLVL